MKDTLLHNEIYDTLDGIRAADNAGVFCAEFKGNDNQYDDFKFIAEKPSAFEGPIPREVLFVSPGWNFIVLFVAMIFIVINKYFSSNKNISFWSMSSQSLSDKNQRDYSVFDLRFVLLILSFILLISLLIQKFFLIFANSTVLYDNFSFYLDIVVAVTFFLLFNYLTMTFYSWLFNTQALIYVYLDAYFVTMSISNVMLIALLMMLFFYPIKIFFVIIVAVLMLVFLIRFIKFLKDVLLLSNVNFVNIFLYLCTFEIIPIMVVVKLIFDVI